MINPTTLDTDTRSTIVDSLRDAEESNEEAYYINGNDVAADMRDTYSLLADKIEAGIVIVDEADINLIDGALNVSCQNCIDLALFDAAAEYETARLAISA